MNEYRLGIIGTFGILLPLVASVFYWLGGRPDGRIWKRYVTPLFLAGALIAFSFIKDSFSWWYLLAVPAYLIPYPGYGGRESLGGKIYGRSIWALCHSARALVFVLISGAWVLWSVSTAFAVVSSVVFGAFNPFDTAPEEEGLIYFSSSFLTPFMV